MVASIAAGTSAAYYVNCADYYAGGKEPQGLWIAVGVEAGVEKGAVVERAPFERLHAALAQDGSSILGHKCGARGHVGGYDDTFSAPKTVSAVWAFAEGELRAGIENAQARSVAAAIAALEENAAFTRSGKDGVYRHKTHLTVASFMHGEARPAKHEDGAVFADMSLHTHAVVLNIGQRPDPRSTGAVNNVHGALDGRALFLWKMAVGATYHCELAKNLQGLGFAIGEVGKNGIFEIVGVAPELRRYFSARRAEIKEELQNAGADSSTAPALAGAITRATRKAKQEFAGDRFAFWRARAEALGFDQDKILDACLNAGREQSAALDEVERQRLLQERLAQIPRELTEHESYFERRQLHAAIASAFVGTGEGAERVEAEIGRLVARQGVVELDRDAYGHEIFSTTEVLTIERDIGEIATRLSARSGHAPDKQNVEWLIEENQISAEQAEAARAATSGETITICEGAPGSGKTTLLKPVVQAWQEAGYRVIGCATAWKVAHALRDDLGIDARATDSWLTTAGNGGHFLDEKTVLVVDEAGLLSSRQMHALLTEVERAARIGKTPARVILTGDRNQLQSVGAGAGLRLLASALTVQKVDQIVRQREQWARDAVRDFGKGEADKALADFAERGLIAEAPGEQATVKSLVDAWNEAKAARPDGSALLIAKTNAQLRAIAAEVRARLREQGTIIGDDVTLSAVSQSGQDVLVALAKGDVIRFLARAKFSEGEVINGTEATVEAIRRIGNDRVEIVARTKDARIRFSPDDIGDEKGRAKIAHAYATTIHGAQGLTVDRVFCWLTPEMNRHDVYVAASRAREETYFFIDAKAVDRRIVAELPLDKRSPETEASAENRRDYLARQLARSGLKHTTVDVLLAAREREEERRRRGFDRVADDAQPKPRRSQELSL